MQQLKISDQYRVVAYSWAQILHQLAKNRLHHTALNLLEVVFFHPIFPNRPQELCSQSPTSGLLLQDVKDLAMVDVIKGCVQVAEAHDPAEPWASEAVSIAIKDERYMELDLMALMRLQKLFPSGTTAVVFAKVMGKTMKQGVFVHEIKKTSEVDRDEVKAEGATGTYNEQRLKEYSWTIVRMLETQLQSKIKHFKVIYKLTIDSEQPYIAYVLKCMARPFAPQKRCHQRSNSSALKGSLTTCINATNPWKPSKTIKLKASLRAFVLHPSEGIIRPKDLPFLAVPRFPPYFSTTPVTAKHVDDEDIKPAGKPATKKASRKRLALPLLRRDLLDRERMRSMELHGTAFPWQQNKLNLTIV